MALVTWTHTFRDGVEPMKNAAVSVYLAGTTTPAQVWDANSVLHATSPQLYTDITGYVEIKVADDYYSLSQAFDISAVPDPFFNEDAETVSLPGMLILQISGKLSGAGLSINLDDGTITGATGSNVNISGGDVNISGGAVNITGGTSTWSAGTMTISGTASLNVTVANGITVTAGNLKIDGGNLKIVSGASVWSGGTISITGSTIAFSSTGALNISASTHTWSGGTINVTGAAINVSSTAKITVTAASGIDIDTGGSLVVTGGSISVTSGSIAISATGSFSMSAGTFEITGGTISISASGGMTIASGSKITVNSTDGIYFSTKGQIFYGADYTHLLATSGNDLYLTGDMVFLDTCTTKSLEPGATTYDIGTSTWHYDEVYADTYYQKTPGSADDSVTSFDHIDDLEIVNRYGGPESPALFDCIPIECTNIHNLAKEEGIEPEEIFNRKDLEDRIFYNPLMVGIFSLGAIKQLYNRVIELEKRIQ